MVVNGSSERVIMDQIQQAMKTIISRMEKRGDLDDEIDQEQESNKKYGKTSSITGSIKKKAEVNFIWEEEKRDEDLESKKRNVVIFTGPALVEIMRDQTMIKSFVTLALIANMMVGSDISPIQK